MGWERIITTIIFAYFRQFVWSFQLFIVILQKKGKAMLGINSPRELVKGLFAQNVRDSLHRATTGNLTASEKKARQNLKNASREWTIVWKWPIINYPYHYCKYSAVDFYINCGFSPSELKNPNKDTLRMFMTLYSEEWVSWI